MVYCSFMPGQITNLTGQKAILFGICPISHLGSVVHPAHWDMSLDLHSPVMCTVYPSLRLGLSNAGLDIQP